MENQIYGAELDLKIDRFKAKANEARQTAQQLGKELGRGVTAYDLKNAGYYVKDFNNELKDTSDEMKQVNVASAKASVSVETGFSKGLKSLKRFALSLFGIRSMWALISRGASAYISQNELLNQQIQLTSYTLGATLAPVIEKVINLAQYGVIIIARLIQFFTGYNALAKVTTKNLNAAGKAAKSLNKNLAGIDELTNLNPDTGGGLADGIGSQLQALNDFQDKIKQVDEWINKFKQTGLGSFLSDVANGISKIDGKTALFVGGSLFALGKLLGVGGAAGTTSILGTLGLIALAAGTVYVAFKKWDSVLKDAKDVSDEIKENLEHHKNTNNNIVNTEKKIRNILKDEEKISDDLLINYKNQVGNSLAVVKNAKDTDNLLESALEKNIRISEITESEVEASQEKVKTLYEAYKLGKLNTSQEEYVKQIILEQLQEYRNIKDTIGESSLAYAGIKDKIIETKKILKDMGVEMPSWADKFKNSYNNAFDETQKKATYVFSKIGGMTSNLSSGIGEIFSALSKTNINSLPTVLKSVVTNKLKSLFSSFNSFDVGTNYIPNDQLAVVHKGEAVVPKKYNPAIGGGLNNNDDVVNAINVLNQTLINKNMNAYISRDDIGKASVDYINNKTRQLGESVIS